MGRIGTVRVEPAETSGPWTHRLTAALFAGSPRVALIGPGVGRVDARGWERRGGGEALARTLHAAAGAAGFSVVRVGIADVAVAADAAAWLAGRRPGIGTIIVPSGESREFLAPLPLLALPISDDLKEIFRALGLRRIGEIAALPRKELEARFGPEGLQAHRWACGEDDRIFRPVRHDEPPEASLELEGAAESLEPLLFVLRHLLDRVCGDLAERGGCAARLRLRLTLSGGVRKEAAVVPARPTRRERLLYDLCRAALERAVEGDTRLLAPVEGVALRVDRVAPAGARQGDLFAGDRWDPLAAAAALSRLRGRLGEEAVVRPSPRPDHRPETRNAWLPVEMSAGRAFASPVAAGVAAPAVAAGLPAPPLANGALRLLPEPLAVRVRTAAGRPVELGEGQGRHELVAAEGPERLSGDWWKDPYRREYFRICTATGELLWIFREYRPSGRFRWWLHGWWD